MLKDACNSTPMTKRRAAQQLTKALTKAWSRKLNISLMSKAHVASSKHASACREVRGAWNTTTMIMRSGVRLGRASSSEEMSEAPACHAFEDIDSK
eukprot:3676735-Amphidinium_carterae.1